MLTLFWESEGPILEHMQAKSETVNKERFCAPFMLRTEPGYLHETRGSLSPTVILQKDKARPHK